jgi:hypothetical protein
MRPSWLAAAAVRAQHDDLARAGVAADADLRVELRVASRRSR